MIFLFQFKLKFKEINSQFFGNQRVFSCGSGGGFIIWNYVFFCLVLFLFDINIYILTLTLLILFIIISTKRIN